MPQNPRMCVLTQTATDLSKYYYQIFKNIDLFFITFKDKNPNAIDFMPNSTWSEGRNRLWEYVKGKYNYYLFIDDDLRFFVINKYIPRPLIAILEKYKNKNLLNQFNSHLYKEVKSSEFVDYLLESIKIYQPEVLSIRTFSNDSVNKLDLLALFKNSRLRATGWFDAQVTLFSDMAANFLLPYDTSFSGWWSSQIPIYVLSSLTFGERSIYLVELGAKNQNRNGVYRVGYNGFQDCKNMSEWLSKGIKKNKNIDLFIDKINNINPMFNSNNIIKSINKISTKKRFKKQECFQYYLKNLEYLFDLKHPYIQCRLKNGENCQSNEAK